MENYELIQTHRRVLRKINFLTLSQLFDIKHFTAMC